MTHPRLPGAITMFVATILIVARGAWPGPALGAEEPPAGEKPDAATRGSPLAFISGGQFGFGWTAMDYEQNAPDSSASFSGSGFEYGLGLLINLHENHVFATLGYNALDVGKDIEEVDHSLGIGTNTLQPDYRRFGLGIALESPGPLDGRYRAEAGYRWVWSDFLRRDFELDDVPIPGAPQFTTENYALDGLSLGGSALVRLSSLQVGGHPLRLRVLGEALFLSKAEIKSDEGALFDTNGFNWEGRAALEAGGKSWSLGLGWRTGGTNLDAAGPVDSDVGPVSRGEETIRLNGISLVLTLGHP